MLPITKMPERSSNQCKTQRLCVLAISASDSSGGSGSQADQRAITSLDAHALCAVTAVTAQPSQGPIQVFPIATKMLRAQIEAALHDFPVAAVKIGLLPSREALRTVAELLGDFKGPVVLDPVFVASSGSRLAATDVASAMQIHLSGCVSLLTPNLDETGILCGRRVSDLATMRTAAHDLNTRGWQAVLVKGGHLPGDEVVDLLVSNATTRAWRHPRIHGQPRGTGCTLSAALAVYLGQGRSLEQAVELASSYVVRAMTAAYAVGAAGASILPCAPLCMN